MTTPLLNRLTAFPPQTQMLQVYTGTEKPDPYTIWFKASPRDEPFDSFLFALTDTFDGANTSVPVRVKMDAGRFVKRAKAYQSFLKKEAREELDAGLEVTTLMEATRILATYHEMVTFPTESQEPMRCTYIHLVHYIMPEGIENPTPFALRVEIMRGDEGAPCECWDIAMSEKDLDTFLDVIAPQGDA